MEIKELSYPGAQLRSKSTGEIAAICTIGMDNLGKVSVGVSANSGYHLVQGDSFRDALEKMNSLYEESPFECYIEAEKLIGAIIAQTKLPPRHTTENWNTNNCYSIAKHSKLPSWLGQWCTENFTISIIPCDNAGSSLLVSIFCSEETLFEKKFKVDGIDIKQVASLINKIFDCCSLMYELSIS